MNPGILTLKDGYEILVDEKIRAKAMGVWCLHKIRDRPRAALTKVFTAAMNGRDPRDCYLFYKFVILLDVLRTSICFEIRLIFLYTYIFTFLRYVVYINKKLFLKLRYFYFL